MNTIVFANKGKRAINQDFILTRNISDENYLYLIADGMGGYNRGDIAAKIVADNISTFLATLSQIDQKDIQMAVNKANLALKQYITDNKVMIGTTVGGVVVNEKETICFWVGDVKIFLFRNNELIFESRPHSLMEELANNGSIRDSERISKYKHVVTRSIQGDRKHANVEFKNLGGLSKEDLIIICSDGVHDIFDGLQLQQTLNSSDKIEQAIMKIESRLIEEASDNFSLIAINSFN